MTDHSSSKKGTRTASVPAVATKRRDRKMDKTTQQREEDSCCKLQGKKRSKSGKKKYKLLRYEELPEYMKDNEFIIKYYRSEWPIMQALLSLFRWHNETLNIWTHLLGFALFLALTVANVIPLPQLADVFGLFRVSSWERSKQSFMLQETVSPLIDTNRTTILKTSSTTTMMHSAGSWSSSSGLLVAPRWPLYIFLSGSIFCFLTSSICHLFCCHSYHLNNLLLRVDFVGITTMIITSFFPPIYYIFQCDPLWQIVYLSTISVFGLCTIVVLLVSSSSSSSSSDSCRLFRVTLFVSMGLFGLVPAVHAGIVNWGNPKRNITLAYESSMAVSYLIGTGFYLSRVPERFKPGWFDLLGHSHQLFHVFTILGALAHYAAALLFLNYRDIYGCSTSPDQ